MSKKQNEASEKLERLCNALTDDIDAMSDEELLAELEEAGEDANDIGNRTAGVIAYAVTNVGRRKLAAARTGYEAERHQTGHGSNVSHWPVSRKRALIQSFAQKDNELEQKLGVTLAAREGKDTDADVDSLIEDMIHLGLIDDEGNAK